MQKKHFVTKKKHFNFFNKKKKCRKKINISQCWSEGALGGAATPKTCEIFFAKQNGTFSIHYHINKNVCKSIVKK